MDSLMFILTHQTIFLICLGIIALFVGSFLNVVIYRLPIMLEQAWAEECRTYLKLKPQPGHKNINLSLPFSHCPHCKTVIRPWHNIPILSFLWLNGKCAYCKAPISLRYPFVEGLTCVLSLFIAIKFGVSLKTLAALIFTWLSICLTLIDLDHHILPDQLTLTLLWFGLFFSIFDVFTPSQPAIIGAISGYLVFAIIQLIFGWVTGKIGMGQGDYKFLAALGAWFGWQPLPIIIFAASLSGIIFALTFMIMRRSFKSIPLPFGPYLAVAGWIIMTTPKELIQFYTQILH